MKWNRVRRWSLIAAMAALPLIGWQCAVNPVTGKSELMLVSREQEIAMGQESDASVVATYGVYDDPEIQTFIEEKGQAMARISHRPDLPYEFKVLDSPVINAFAVPGGYVYFTRGILAYLNNEAEFAGVLGHEIGHITARHSAKQVSRAQLAQLGLGIGSIISQDFAQYANIASAGLGLVFMKFGRDAERQSDDLGVEYSTDIGYNSYEMANFFRTLDRMSPDDGGALPSWFSTHPMSSERVDNVREATRQLHEKQNINAATLKVNRESYLRLIDGLVFGEDPRQGYFADGVFYHPDLKFQFPVPADWKGVNTPSQVQIGSPDDQAAILFSLASQSTTEAAAQTFIQNAKATVVSQRNDRVNGAPATVVESQIASQSGTLGVLSYFIAYSGNVYTFHGFSASTAFSGYRGVFQTTMEGFRALNDPVRINVQPDRIRIRNVPRDGTVREALTALGVADDRLELHSLINGMELTDAVSRNSLIKVIAR